MRWARVYAVGAVGMAAVLVLDTTTLLFGPPGPVDLVASLLELVWLVVSLGTVIHHWRAELPLGLPASFVAYSMASWIHSFYLIGSGVTPERLRLPLWVVAAIDAYAVGYGYAAVRALRRLGRRVG